MTRTRRPKGKGMLSGDTPLYKLREHTSVPSTGEWDVRKTETMGEIHATRPATGISVKHPRAAAWMTCKLHKKKIYPRGTDLHLSPGLPARGNAILVNLEGAPKPSATGAGESTAVLLFAFQVLICNISTRLQIKKWYKNVNDRHVTPIPLSTCPHMSSC